MKSQPRDTFRETIFKRDKHLCVVPGCGKPAVDAHHLIERRLWENGGYTPDNGVSVCELHHKNAETNHILPQTLREWAGITKIVLPNSFNEALEYDKWGVPLPFPNRKQIKYPSTSYLYNSPNITDGETVEYKEFVNIPLILSTKMDGSNVCLSRHLVAARNGAGCWHSSFDMLKALHSEIAHKIPENLQIFGEWLYAKHSIHYAGEKKLSSYLQVFAVYDQSTHMFFGWQDTIEVAKNLGLTMVPYIEISPMFSSYELEGLIYQLGVSTIKTGHEGVVLRSAYPFHYSQFKIRLGKFVRANHVQTDIHWSNQKIIKNEVKC